jgi:hypothetical protein
MNTYDKSEKSLKDARKLDSVKDEEKVLGRPLTDDELVDWVALSKTLPDVTDQHVLQVEKSQAPQVILDQVEGAKKAQIEERKRVEAETAENQRRSEAKQEVNKK